MTNLAPFREKQCLTGGCSTCGICLANGQEEPMVTQTHTVATDALATLGTIIDERAGRDAIHLAVEPIVAGATLQPGQDVGIVDGKAFPRRPYLGIVDPFLTKSVREGERFWLVVYPRQITSLRHVWEHPSFPAADALIVNEEAISDSEAWIRRYAEEIDETYNTLMSAADNWLKTGERFYGASDEYGMRGKFEGEYLRDDFWDHYQAVRGVIVPRDEQESFFSCSC